MATSAKLPQTLFISNIPPKVEEQELRHDLEVAFGPVVTCEFVTQNISESDQFR
eukprot:m.47038 g.47038  ORF g.47038 m.47038 type:complete len:54 (+) comp10952_c0_seq1:333-494(+)